jgi:3-hydroxyacyl-[acyl-carrier-protein] dehydratase
VSGRQQIVDFSEFDLGRVVADLEVIRRYNPQRFEMEQLTAIVFEDPARNVCVGYKDVTDQEFWVRGHMPGNPLMPGVIMCEAAAQLCGYYVVKHDFLGSKAVGFGALEDVRFREPVRPPCRLVLMAELLKVRRKVIITSRFQGYVNQTLVVEGAIKGIPLPEQMAQRP